MKGKGKPKIKGKADYNQKGTGKEQWKEEGRGAQHKKVKAKT